jgi:uncharacterized membrane protein
MTERELESLERWIGRLLRGGVAASASILFVGLTLWAAGAREADAVLRAGLLVLIAIPLTRIVASFFDAIRRRDRLLSWSTGLVLVIMVSTILYSWRLR